jgi:predicted 3-demethylubiquinone-9 3-methyltransferase (glyoxalase superfamily)
MKKPIYPCIWFDGQAKAAADFYCSLFPSSRIITDTPMVVTWELFGKPFMGLNGGPQFKVNPSISFFVLAPTIAETERIWDALMAGGQAMMPLDKYDWSEKYGWLRDRFGVTWQIMVSDQNGAKATVTPSFLFTGERFGQAENAMKFYTGLFDNSRIKDIIPFPDEDPNAGKVLYSEFTLGGYDLIAMDGPGEHGYTFNEGVSFVVECEDQAEIDYFWDRMTADGGEESMCGWLKDKFGVSWQIIPAILPQLMNDPERGQRVVDAFLKMKKFDIESLVNA